MNQNLF